MATTKPVSAPKPPKPKKKELKNYFKEIATIMVVFSMILLVSALFTPIFGIGIAGFIIFGPNVNDAYGKTGNVIDSHNAYGHYQRGYKIPSSLTSGQSTVRQRLKIISKLWKGSTINRESFVNYSEAHEYMKRGRMIKLRANAWFNEFNIIASLLGTTIPLLHAPTVDTLFPLITGISCGATSTPDAVTVTPIKIGDYPTGCKALIYASRPVSPGIMSYKTPQYYLIGSYDPTTIPAIDITDKYEAMFGEISEFEGMFIWFEFRLAMPTGEATIMQRNYTEIVTT